MIACHVNATSALVNGTPSCQRTLRRKWYVIVRPPAEMPPFFSEGTSAASIGTTLPCWSNDVNTSE